MIKCWIFHIIYWRLYWKWKTGWPYAYRWLQVYLLFTPVIVWLLELQFAVSASIMGVSYHLWLAWEKIKIQRFLLNAYHFHIVKSKSQKLGTICISLYIPHFHYPFIHWLTLRLLPCLDSCNMGFTEHAHAAISWRQWFCFLWLYTQK